VTTTTVVVIGREAFSPTEQTVRRIVAETPPPRRLVVVDGGSPRRIARRLESLARELDFTLVRSDAVLSAPEARNLGLAHVTTEFVAFVDNDLIVAAGWLEGLERCARETGAAFVSPVVLWGPTGLDEVHFAGGTCHIVDDGGSRRLEDIGHRMHQPLSVVAKLRREPIELIELHCILARWACLDQLGAFDEAYLAGRDETDLSLEAARRGWSVWLEPAVVVGYPSPKHLRPSDYLYYLPRWSDAWWNRSLLAFRQKWGVENERDDVYRLGHRQRRIGRFPGTKPGWAGRRVLAAWKIRRALDLAVTPALVIVADRRRRRARPARVVHAASWDVESRGLQPST
jgi:GT2 family glycosyltransferase